MRSISKALARLHEDGAWFARAHEVRLLVVRTSSDLRKEVLKRLSGLEFHADNFSPWVLLEDAHTAESDGWQARAVGMVEDWDRRREAFAEDGITLPALTAQEPRPVAARNAEAKVRISPFLLTAAAVVKALQPPLQGLVAILAPTQVDDAPGLAEELGLLLSAPVLAVCRFVLVLDSDVEPPRRLLAALGQRALDCDCSVDPSDLERDLEAMLADAAGKPAMGMARPRGVTPPRRVDDPPDVPKAQIDAALRAAGVDPRFPEAAPKLRDLVFGAALAMKQGRGADAVRMQREARDLCASLDMHQVQVICQVALASYLSGLGLPKEAVRELEDAAQTAQAHGLAVQESQAYLALGLLHSLGKRLGPAVHAYVQAARSAEAAQSPLLAIESWRLAAQLAAHEKLIPQAMSAFQEALRVASGADTQVTKASSAPEAARALARLCRAQDLRAQAESLEAQADAMERGEPTLPLPSQAGA